MDKLALKLQHRFTTSAGSITPSRKNYLALQPNRIVLRSSEFEAFARGFNKKAASSNQSFRTNASAVPEYDGIDGNNNGGDGGKGEGGDGNGGEGSNSGGSGPLYFLVKGWKDRVDADPEFIFKLATEQIIGVSGCVIGDMASRPNFGLNELDFVFCTLVVGSIVNFALMYLLAPTSSAGNVAKALPWIFAGSPTGHMFEAGAYNVAQRFGTFIYKGVTFAAVGFLAGLAGTAISNALLLVRQKLDPNFVLQNEPPPTVLNAATWALHLGISSNIRYQSLNGLDQVLVKSLGPNVFKAYSFLIRGGNNLIGGSSFAVLARYTGSQKSGTSNASPEEKSLIGERKSGTESS